jgi:ankyrin repeat protein
MDLQHSLGVKKGHEAVVKLLLAKDGIKLDFKDSSGRTTLSYAAGNGHEAIVKLLLVKDCVYLNSKDTVWGLAPLLWAAERGGLLWIGGLS